MRIGLFWRVLPVHLLIASIFLFPLAQRHHAQVSAQQAGERAQAVLAQAPQAITPVKIQGVPVRIILPRLAIDVPVVTGTYNNVKKTWSVAASTANYAPNTTKINNTQDISLIYGHWTRQVLGPTKNLIADDVAYVYTDNNHVFKYTYTGKNIVKATDIQIFEHLKSDIPGLLLMTCDGSWAQNRRLMYFVLAESQ